MTPGPADPFASLSVGDAADMGQLPEVAALFASIWGRNAEGVPISSEMMRSLIHAGGLVSVVRDAGGLLLGAAVLGRAEPGACYGYIAAAAPQVPDRGIGFALKQHQRSWALAHGMTVMRWTFDPLVSRNAHFNLTKLGARAHAYLEGFYGVMDDALNGRDVADRLEAEWRLDSAAAVAAAQGRPAGTHRPAGDGGEAGPDGRPALVDEGAVRWVRVPADIVALRRSRQDEATHWRASVRAWLTLSFAEGFVAVGATRDGWYRLERGQP